MEAYEKELWNKATEFFNTTEDPVLDDYFFACKFPEVYKYIKEKYFPELTIKAIAEIVGQEYNSYEEFKEENPESIIDPELTKETFLEATEDDNRFTHILPLNSEKELSSIIDAVGNNPRSYLIRPSMQRDYIYVKTREAKNNELFLVAVLDREKLEVHTDSPTLKDLIDTIEDNQYLEDYKSWNDIEGKAKRISDYRKFAHIGEDVEITEENLDEQALNKTSFINYNYPKEAIIKELLNKLN